MYVIANNENEVYEKINELNDGSWEEKEKEESSLYNEDFEIIGTETLLSVEETRESSQHS